MLPLGRFPRFLFVSVFLIAALLFASFVFLRPSWPTILGGNCLDLLTAVLAAAACFYRSRGTSGHPRQLWTLLALAFTLQASAQAITTCYQSFVPSAAQSPWPSDILFFLWPAPVFLMFLPASDESLSGINWIRVLDFLQVAIVAITMYLYFFFSPSRWLLEQPTILRQILVVYVIRDLLFALGFAFRSRDNVPAWFRSFCIVLTLVFSAAALSDLTDFVLVTGATTIPALSDLMWALPGAAIVLFAATWTRPSLDSLRFSDHSRPAMPSSQLLPVIVPLLVIFMSYAIAREHFLLAWLAVAASVVSSGCRLILTGQQQQRVTQDLLNTEKTLRRTEHTLSSAFRSSPDAFSINPFPNGAYFEVNDGFTSLTGYSRADAIGKTPRDLNLWLDPSLREKILQQLTQNGLIRDVEFRFRKKSGEIRFGNLSAALIDYDGTPCSLVMVRDITDRREAEEVLRSREERFRSLVQNLHVGILSYDAQARIVYANAAVLEILDVPLDRIVGKTVKDLNLVAIYEDGSPIPDHLRPVPTAIATRLPQRNCLIGWRIPGRSEPVWTLLDAIPELSATGELSRVVVSFTNLTEQRRAIDALRESEERFRTLVRDLHVAVVLSKPDGRMEFVNRAAVEMVGLTETDALGKTILEIGMKPVDEHGKPIPDSERPIGVVLRTKKPVRNVVMGFQLPRDPQNILWIFGNSVPQFDSNGNLLRVISSFSDISELKNAERAIHSLSSHLLKLQDEERRRLGRELHDGLAQTVLAINLSLAQARQSIQPADELAGRALDKARQLTQQISREIRTLSYLLHPPLLDDLGLVSALKEYAQGFTDRSGIDTQLFVLTSFDRLPQSVETALFRVVQESLANIQRHSGSTTAKIRVRQENSLVTLEVVDSGKGMPPSNGDSPSPEARFGVGIPGMRERMTLLGGSLDIFSDDNGTTVRATIPLAPLSPGEPSAQRTEA